MNHDVIEALDELGNSVNTKFKAVAELQSEVRGLSDQVMQMAQREAKWSPGDAQSGSLMNSASGQISKALREHTGFQQFKGGARDTGQIDLGFSFKALTSTQGSPDSPPDGVDVQANRDRGLYGYALRPLTLLEALPSRQVTSNALTFNRLVSYSNAADYQNGEGVTKPEQDLSPDLITAPVATIAVHHTASKQVLDDEPGLMLNIEILLRHGCMDKAERELVAGAGGAFEIEGLNSLATTFVHTASQEADRVGEAISSMQAAGYQPDIVALHPSDWFAINSERATGGEYVGPGWAGRPVPSIWNVPVAISPAITAGSPLVIDSRFVQVLDRMQPTVEMSREHSDNFTRNNVTILAELRLGLAVYDLQSVYKVDLLASG